MKGMEKIELVIKVPRAYYELVLERCKEPILLNAFKDGTLLPKGCDIQRIIPKRVDVQKWIYTKCPNPNCNYELSTHHGDGYYSIAHKPDFCPKCGQALLWKSEVEE